MSRIETIAEGVTLYLGDCREILPLPHGTFDACVTDPPYGIGEHGGRFRARRGGGHRLLPNRGWDASTPSQETFDLIRTFSSEQIIWGGNYFADKLPPSKGWLYWQKLMGGDFSDGELAWTSRNKALREFTYCPKFVGLEKRAEHPTQKPVEVMTWCLSLLPDAKTILDPFMGSGSTGVAAVILGRQFTGIEIDPDYFSIACKRISEQLRRPSLFVDPPKPAKQEAFEL